MLYAENVLDVHQMYSAELSSVSKNVHRLGVP